MAGQVRKFDPRNLKIDRKNICNVRKAQIFLPLLGNHKLHHSLKWAGPSTSVIGAFLPCLVNRNLIVFGFTFFMEFYGHENEVFANG